MESTGWLFFPLFPGRIGIWKCWFLWREENRSTRRKTLGAGTRTNNKLNPHMTPSSGIEPGPHWWEASALTTAPSLLLFRLNAYTSLLTVKISSKMDSGAIHLIGSFFCFCTSYTSRYNCRIKPKSPILSRLPCPTRMFLAAKSLWTKPFSER